MNKRYLYLLAWVEGSDSASGELTKVHQSTDLMPQYMAGNEHIFAVEVHAPNLEAACMAGDAKAFHNNYTGADSVSTVDQVGDGWQHPPGDGPVRVIVTRNT